jgi:hypothetical protein
MMRPPRDIRDDAANVEAWEGPYEGIPPWLGSSLDEWVRLRLVAGKNAYGTQSWSVQALRSLERALHQQLDWSTTGNAVNSVRSMLSDDLLGIRLLDWCLGNRSSQFQADQLSVILTEGHSAWDVGVDEQGQFELQRRVDPIVAAAVKSAAPPGSRPAVHLAKAWSSFYGVSQDASTSYRESVRAVEAAAKQVILPNDPSATLGTMIPAMRAKPSKWKVALNPPAPVASVESVATTMELIWKAQLDRHGTDDAAAPFFASPDEAEAALHLACALVHLFTSGAIDTL